jgi:hypothetical protein
MSNPAASPGENYVQLYSTYLEVKTKDEARNKSRKTIVFRIYIQQTDDELTNVRFQISNDDQLEYLFEITYNKDTFATMKAHQHLELDFPDFPNVVRQQILAVLRETDVSEADRRYKVIFTDIDDRSPDDADDDYDDRNAGPVADDAPEEEEEEQRVTYFIVYEKLEFCRAQVFKFEFNPCKADRTAAISQARYDELTAKLKALETEYKDAYKRVQRTNPSVLKGFKTDLETQS